MPDFSMITNSISGASGLGGGLMSSINMMLGLAVQYIWLLVIIGAFFAYQRFRRTYSIMGILINKRGASDSIRIDFGQLVRVTDEETGIGVNGIRWRGKKKTTEMLPSSCYYMSNWGFAVAIIREGVNGELVPVVLRESGNEAWLKPLDADVEAIRQDRYLALAKFHNPKKQKWYETPIAQQVVFAMAMIVCVYLMVGAMKDVGGAMSGVASALKDLVGGIK